MITYDAVTGEYQFSNKHKMTYDPVTDVYWFLDKRWYILNGIHYTDVLSWKQNRLIYIKEQILSIHAASIQLLTKKIDMLKTATTLEEPLKIHSDIRW